MSRSKRLYLIWKTLTSILWVRVFSPFDFKEKTKNLIFVTVKELGGIYLKFLQILTINAQFLSDLITPTELEIFEQVPLEEINLEQTLARELNEQQRQRLQKVETKPFASGSFAQVYRAKLDGKLPVIIKVLRPQQTKFLPFDLKILQALVRLVTLITKNNGIDLIALFQDFKSLVIKETDYQREQKNATWFYQYFSVIDKVVVPRPYLELSTTKIIVQEELGGISLAELMIAEKNGLSPEKIVKEKFGSDLQQQLKTLGVEFLKSTVMADFVHGDPHPGNIRVLAENKIGLLDFGLIAHSSRNRFAYFDYVKNLKDLYEDNFNAGTFALTLIDLFYKKLALALDVLNDYFFSQQQISLRQEISDFVNKKMAVTIGQTQVQSLLHQKKVMPLFVQVINKNNNFAFKTDLEDMALMKAALTYLKVLRQFMPLAEYNQAMKEITTEVVALVEEEDNFKTELSRGRCNLSQAWEIVSDWLTDLAEAENPLFYNLNQTLKGKINA